MIELNLLEKKKPLVLPTVIGINLNHLNLKMFVIGLVLYYLPGPLNSILFSSQIQEIETQLSDISSQNEKLVKNIDKESDIKNTVTAYKLQLQRLQNRSVQVDEILKTRTNPKKVLEKIARSIPEDVWFDSLEISNKNEIKIKGGAYSHRSIGEFITGINDSPYFSGSVTPTLQENRNEMVDGIMTNYEVYELKGRITNYDMRSN